MTNTAKRIKHLDMADEYLNSSRCCPHCGGVIQFQENKMVDRSTEHMIYACEHCNAVTEEIFKRVGLHFPDSNISVPLPDWQDAARI